MQKLLSIISFNFFCLVLPGQGVWTQKADFGGSAREYAVGFSLEKKGYIGLGRDNLNQFLNDFWEWDRENNSWSQKQNFQGAARQSATGFSIGNKAYIGTGIAPSYKKDFWEWDNLTNTWTQKANFGGTERYGALGFAIGTKGYICTGVNFNNSTTYFKDLWEYDVVLNQWTQKADLTGPPRYWAVAFVIGEKAYIGTGSSNVFYKDFWEWDQTTDIWTLKASLPGLSKERNAAVAFSVGNKGYVGTGFGQSERSDFWEYDPDTDSWKTITYFGGGIRKKGIGFSIDSLGYAGTGSVSLTFKKDFWEYNPNAVNIVYDRDEMKKFAFFPNPANRNDDLRFTVPENFGSGEICLYHLNGKEVACFKISSGKTFLSLKDFNLGTGIYIYQLKAPHENYEIKKLVVL